MTKHFNQLTFVGNLGQDPELRFTASGKQVVNFSVASSDQFNNSDGEKQNVTTWFKCTAWNKAAEIYKQYLHKGSKVLIMGKLVPNEQGSPKIWTGSDNEPHASFEVSIRELYFLDSANANASTGEADVMDKAPEVAKESQSTEDEFPF